MRHCSWKSQATCPSTCQEYKPGKTQAPERSRHLLPGEPASDGLGQSASSVPRPRAERGVGRTRGTMCPFALQPSGKRGQRSALRLADGGVGGQGGQGLGLTRKDEIRPHQSGSVIFAGLSGGPVLRAEPGSEQWASPSQLAAPGLAREVSFHGTDASWRWGMPCKSSSASQRAPGNEDRPLSLSPQHLSL